MAKVQALPAKKLRASLDPTKIKYSDSTEIPLKNRVVNHQPRALQAFELGLHIRGHEYNIFVAGEENLGRTYFVCNLLAPKATKASTPPDLLYVNNFEDRDKPVLITLPAGEGRKFKAAMSRAVGKIKTEVPAGFEKEAYFRKRESLYKKFRTHRESLFNKMEDEAFKKNFNLDMDEEGSLTLYPLVDGKPLPVDDFEKLEPKRQKEIKNKREEVLDTLSRHLRKLQVIERGYKEKEERLDRNFVAGILEGHLCPIQEQYKDNQRIVEFLEAVEADILDNIDRIVPPDPQDFSPFSEPAPQEDIFRRYAVNLFVNNAETKGAPVIRESHPAFFNLLGSMERESELGALSTDFSLVKAGALHKANGGYLVLHADDVLVNTGAWEGLLRALRSGVARIEDPGDNEQPRTRTLDPEPVPLDVKVILTGTDDLYESLLYHDDRFRKLFKIKAHLQASIPRTMPEIRGFLRDLARIADEADLLPFDKTALAGLVDESSFHAEDQTRLSLRMPLIRELMIEASALAQMSGQDSVSLETLKKARRAREFRANLYEDEFLEDYDREILKVATTGEAIGRVNGLSVTFFGDYEFGLPHQIAATVGTGDEGVVDLEREAELGGPIHTKAMMILKTYLLGQFAHDKPLILSGSLCFEQSYAGVEGDSASGAELAALISALAEVPINLSYAFTGAVSQSGSIMAVGGVTRKIEGFYQVCERRGLTGDQGVIIPYDNINSLMLKRSVVTAVEKGIFNIYPVRTIEEALLLLTGMQAGSRRKDGTFSKGSLYRMVDDRLRNLSAIAQKTLRKRR